MVDTDANRLDVAKTFGATKLVHGNGVDENLERDRNTNPNCVNSNKLIGTREHGGNLLTQRTDYWICDGGAYWTDRNNVHPQDTG